MYLFAMQPTNLIKSSSDVLYISFTVFVSHHHFITIIIDNISFTQYLNEISSKFYKCNFLLCLMGRLFMITGGRNVTVSLQSRTGHTNMLAVVGVLVFTQYWYWFPLAHCLALAFTPTSLIALNAQLKVSCAS